MNVSEGAAKSQTLEPEMQGQAGESDPGVQDREQPIRAAKRPQGGNATSERVLPPIIGSPC